MASPTAVMPDPTYLSHDLLTRMKRVTTDIQRDWSIIADFVEPYDFCAIDDLICEIVAETLEPRHAAGYYKLMDPSTGLVDELKSIQASLFCSDLMFRASHRPRVAAAICRIFADMCNRSGVYEFKVELQLPV